MKNVVKGNPPNSTLFLVNPLNCPLYFGTGERSHISEDMSSGSSEGELRPVNELANTNYEEVEASNRKSHIMRQAPEPLQSHKNKNKMSSDNGNLCTSIVTFNSQRHRLQNVVGAGRNRSLTAAFSERSSTTVD